jgi:hypothetical protein
MEEHAMEQLSPLYTYTRRSEGSMMCRHKILPSPFLGDLIESSSSGVWRHVIDRMVPNILKERVPLCSGIKHPSSYCTIAKDEGTMILCSIRKHLPYDSVTSQKTRLLHCIAVRTSNSAMTELFLYFQMSKQNRGIICSCQEMSVAYMFWNYHGRYMQWYIPEWPAMWMWSLYTTVQIFCLHH